MNKGQKVLATEYGGTKIVRRVISDNGSTVLICNENEYLEAMREKREPQGVGFPRDSVKLLSD